MQTEADVLPEWFDAANVVGLTAGTSTPDAVIDRVEAQVRLCADASASAPASADRSARQVEAGIEAMPRSVAAAAKGRR